MSNWLQIVGSSPTRLAKSFDTVQSSIKNFIPVMCNSFEPIAIWMMLSKYFLQDCNNNFLAMTPVKFLLEFLNSWFLVSLRLHNEYIADILMNCICFTLDFKASESPRTPKIKAKSMKKSFQGCRYSLDEKFNNFSRTITSQSRTFSIMKNLNALHLL